jgi:hypothetical protein
MKINRFIFVMMTLLVMTSACSKSDEEEKEPLVNHSNKGDMAKQLEDNPFQGYGTALDKAHNVTDTLQQGADQTKVQDTLHNQQ